MKRCIATLPQGTKNDENPVTVGKEAREKSREAFRGWAAATEAVIDSVQVMVTASHRSIVSAFVFISNNYRSYHSFDLLYRRLEDYFHTPDTQPSSNCPCRHVAHRYLRYCGFILRINLYNDINISYLTHDCRGVDIPTRYSGFR